MAENLAASSHSEVYTGTYDSEIDLNIDLCSSCPIFSLIEGRRIPQIELKRKRFFPVLKRDGKTACRKDARTDF